MNEERREGRRRLVAHSGGDMIAECAIWRPDAPITKQVVELLERVGSSRIWLRRDVFELVAGEQGIRPGSWPRMEFVSRYYARIGCRDDRPVEKPELPNVFECGCSRHKVAAGLCSVFAPDGTQRGSRPL